MPLTADAKLFARAVKLGREVIWLHTYGERFADPEAGRPSGAPRLPADQRPMIPRGGAIPAAPEPLPDIMDYDASRRRLHIGGGYNFPWGRVQLTIAHHGSSLPDGSYGGSPAGLLLTFAGKNIYHAGDTGLFYDMKLIGERRLDLAMVPIGDNFTMGPDDALRAVALLEPKIVVPMHYDTFDVIEQDPNHWSGQVETKTDTKVRVLAPGESVRL